MKIFLYVLSFCVLFVLYVRYLENKMLFVPAKEILADPSEIGLQFEDVYFLTKDQVKLNGWFIPARNARATLIFCHGNAGNIGDRLGKIELFHRLGLSLFIFDYRGYGNSQGRPTEKGMYQDTLSAYDYVMTRDSVDAARIIVYGASLGGTAAIDLATQRKFAGVIVDSSFTNAVDMGKRIVPFVPSFLLRIKLDSAAKIKALRAPILFLHSVDDEMVPYDLGRKLYELANEPKQFVDLRGGHNDGHIDARDDFIKAVADFIERIGL